jgi:alpha/beta superfamily hydrolase
MLGSAAVEIQVEPAAGLRGIWHRAAGTRARPAVLLLHGFTGQRTEEGRLFVLTGRALARAGIDCLRCDFRGSGDSDGDFDAMTLTSELADARAALAWLLRQTRIDRARLGLIGLSLGSVVAQLLAARAQPAALVLWAGIAHPAEIFSDALLADARARGFAAGAAFVREIRASHPLDQLSGYRGAFLCVRGQHDFVPAAHSQAALRLVSGRLIEIPGGDHCFGEPAGKRAAIAATVRFLQRALLGTANPARANAPARRR